LKKTKTSANTEKTAKNANATQMQKGFFTKLGIELSAK